VISSEIISNSRSASKQNSSHYYDPNQFRNDIAFFDSLINGKGKQEIQIATMNPSIQEHSLSKDNSFFFVFLATFMKNKNQ
jgi:hypothetical protein